MESKPGEDPGPLAAAAAASFPLLVYDHDNSQTMLSVADGSTQTFQIPEMRNLRCVETPQGLVLTVNPATLECSLWNPQTGENTALPAMDEDLPDHCQCLVSDVSSPPPWVMDDGAAPDSLVLIYELARPHLLFCRIRGGGGGVGWAWAKHTYDVGLYEVPGQPITKRTIFEMTVLMGMFFYLDPQGNAVGTFVSCAGGEPKSPPCLEFYTFDAPMPTLRRAEEEEGVTATKCYILESYPELFLVRLLLTGPALDHIEKAAAYVMDLAEREWRKVDDIGDKAFLLGYGGFAASRPAAAHGLKRGCVYFACDDHGDSNDCHVFDLKEGTREVIRPTQDIPVTSRKPYWLVPVVP